MMITTLREESEHLLLLKSFAPDGKLPRGLLLEGRTAIRHGKHHSINPSAIKEFGLARNLDKNNERAPKRRT